VTFLTIGLSLSPTWVRGQSWRRPDSRVEELFSAGPYVEAAQRAEAACLDFVFKPDALALNTESLAQGPGFSAVDPIVLMTAAAQATEHISVIPTVSSTYSHPYTSARQLQSLDHLSGGRVGWNVVTSLGGQENFPERTPPTDTYANAEDFVAMVEALRRTYPSESLRIDREAGVYADPTMISTASPRGRYRSTGPLTVPAISPRRWPLLHAGASEASALFAASHADAVFAMAASEEDARKQRAGLRERALLSGRTRAPRLLPGLALTLMKDRSSAQELAASARSDAPAHVRHWHIVGNSADAIREIAARASKRVIDGFIALPVGSWESVEIFFDDVVPTLQDMGIARAEYSLPLTLDIDEEPVLRAGNDHEEDI